MNNNSIFRLDMSHVGDSGIAVSKTQPVVAFPMHNHTFYEISFYSGGVGNFNINTLPFIISKPTVVLMTPADIHGINHADEGFYSIKVAFKDSLLPDRQILPNTAYVYECCENTELLEKLFQELLCNQNDIKYAAFLLSSIILKVVKSGFSVIPTEIDPVYDHIAKAIKFINDNFCDNITLTQTAELLHISPQYLSSIFKKTLGITFVNYVCQLRLHYSTQLLSKKNTSITEIAFMCGFGNVSHFLRSFKKEFGISPGAYRKVSK